MDEALQGELLDLLKRIELDDLEVEYELEGRTVTVSDRVTKRGVGDRRFKVRYVSISVVEPAETAGMSTTHIDH